MPEKVKWGVLGVAKIATTKVIPAMQAGEWTEVTAIASRDIGKARGAAERLGISNAYGSYEELLADPEIEAIYNPLPNHLHVPWSIRAAQAGKHVLCEKPVALNAAECRSLTDAQQETGVKIGEAFMVRTHPQWLRAREIVASAAIGEVRAINATFSYFNRDASNVRNVAGWGGGALMDIGCYPIQVSRFLLRQEPVRVLGLIDRDPDFHTDRLTTALLEFPSTHCLFTCGTQMAPYQRVVILGTTGRIEIEIPFNAPPDKHTRIYADPAGWEVFPICDQYTIQGDLFSQAVRGLTEVPTPLEDSLKNMAVIDAVFESANSGNWVIPEKLTPRTSR